MSYNKPIDYESLHYLLRHMDPSLRFILIRRCPSIVHLDRRVPIRIRDLHFDPTRFKIDDTTFTIGVVQIYRNERTPRCIEEQNDRGGVLKDVDRYGIDVRDRRDVRYQGEKRRRNLLQQLDSLMRVVCTDRDLQKVQEVREKFELEDMRTLSFILRNEHAEPPFNHYLQFMMKSDRGVWVERFNYSTTIAEARDYILSKLFGGAGRTVEVFKLHYEVSLGEHVGFVPHEIDDPWDDAAHEEHDEDDADEDDEDDDHDDDDAAHEDHDDEPRHVPAPALALGANNHLLPLAPGKLELHHLKLAFNVRRVIDSIQPILWNKPLKSLETTSREIPEGIRRDPFVASIKRIIISEKSTIGILSSFLNENVHLEYSDFGTDEVIDLLRDWQDRGLRIGTYYSIGFRLPGNIEDFLNEFKEIPGAQRGELAETRFTAFPECIILPVWDSSELNVYCEATTVEDQKFCDRPYTVKIKVQPRGYAYNLYL